MGWRSSSHAKYSCQYHLVWCPKRRKKLSGGEICQSVAETIRRIGEEYEIEILEMSVEEDHVHLLVSFPPRYSIARVVGIIKSVSARKLFSRFPWLRERFWAGELWERGYAARTVGDRVTTDIIKRYIQRHEESASNQLELF